MNEENVKKLIVEAAVAKVKRADSLGLKISWSMDDQIAVAVQVMQSVAADPQATAESWEKAIRATYNHSAVCQKLEKVFAGTGHFVRQARTKGTVEDYMETLAKQLMTK